MNYLKIDKTSISNGLGVRVVLWCAGCTQQCKNCFNPETWDFNAGKPFDEDAKVFLFKQLSKPYIKGITFSGGHPIEKQNAPCIYKLMLEIKDQFPNKDIWLYTGQTLSIDDFQSGYIDRAMTNEIFRMCDIIVDGPYIETQRDITLPFRGSTNQRIIDVKQSLAKNQIIQYKIN